MKSKHISIVLVLWTCSALVGVFRIIYSLVTDHSLDATAGTILGLLAGVLICMAVIVPIARISRKYIIVRDQLIAQGKTVYMVLPEGASTYKELVADDNGLSLFKVKGRTPVLVRQWQWAGIALHSDTTSTSTRTFSALAIEDTTGKKVKYMIRPYHSSIFAAPLQGQDLEDVIKALLSKSPGGSSNPV
jgi:hypothetical protein